MVVRSLCQCRKRPRLVKVESSFSRELDNAKRDAVVGTEMNVKLLNFAENRGRV